jgi:alkylation response protein AidB-like acyl-CoA dehydrogenase
MDQPGVEVRPIIQITGGGEFNETFFTDARTSKDLIVGEPGNGWAVAMGLLALERGISTLAQQVGFERELATITDIARTNGAAKDPVMRQRLADSWTGLQLMKWNALRSMSGGVPGPEASISKLFWSSWHRALGELAVDVLGSDAMVFEGEEMTLEQKLFLYTRSDTIYGGSNQVQRNILGERVLGLPKEPVL